MTAMPGMCLPDQDQTGYLLLLQSTTAPGTPPHIGLSPPTPRGPPAKKKNICPQPGCLWGVCTVGAGTEP